MPQDFPYSRAAVAAPHTLAAEAGRDIVLQGGDAIEAMIAMAAAIAVVYPHMNSIGGDGFWLIRDARGKARAIEACGTAGERATAESYRKLGGIPSRGPKAALTAPGTVGGWMLALELSKALGGRLPLKDLLGRAESLARIGVAVSPSEARFDPLKHPDLVAAPGFAKTFFLEGKPAPAGATRKLPRLADTLDRLGHAGLDDFYRGDIAREIAGELEEIGSPVTRADLRATAANWRAPLSMRVKNATLFNTPAPTQGLASLMLLGLYERLAPRNVEEFAHAHALVEGFKRAAKWRDEACVDFAHATADFDKMLSPAFLEAECEKIDKQRAAPWPLKADAGDTVWMGAVDSNGVSVSFIQSVYWEYGSGCVLERTGITMPNRGLAFSLEPGVPNALKPGRRPFHTLNPALAVFNDGRVMPYGAMGGDGQPQFQGQVFTRINAGASLEDSVAAPRHLFGRAWGDTSTTLKLEEAYDDSTASALVRAGHEIEWRAGNRDLFGHAGALVRTPDGRIAAAHDPRSDGAAMGF